MPLKKENNNDKIITCKLKFNDSYRFMSTSLSNLADNLSGISEIHGNKKIRLNCEFIGFKNGRLNKFCNGNLA